MAVLIAASDMPNVEVTHFHELISEWRNSGARVASNYGAALEKEFLGIPAIFPRADWPALCELHGDRGARELLNNQSTLSVFIRSGSFDLDTPADVERWRATHPSHS